jgi:hypothetical protein
VVAFRVAASPASTYRVEVAMSTKGMAELIVPITKKCYQFFPGTRTLPSRAVYVNNATAAMPTRNAISIKGPSTGAAIRMNRNEAPHNAERVRSIKKSRGFTQRALRCCVPARVTSAFFLFPSGSHSVHHSSAPRGDREWLVLLDCWRRPWRQLLRL